MNAIETELFCLFKTTLGQSFEVPLAKHSLPANTTNEELNHILRKLLESNSKQVPRNFDFIIKNEILLGSLKSHLLKVGLSGERNVEIFYVLSFGKPEVDNSLNVTNGIARLFFHQGCLIRKQWHFGCQFQQPVECPQPESRSQVDTQIRQLFRGNSREYFGV